MDEYERAIDAFLEDADACLDEYRDGYSDADATLRRLETHVEELRNAVE